MRAKLPGINLGLEHWLPLLLTTCTSCGTHEVFQRSQHHEVLAHLYVVSAPLAPHLSGKLFSPLMLKMSDLIRMEVASSRPDYLPTLSAAKTSKLSQLVTTFWRLMRRANNNNNKMSVLTLGGIYHSLLTISIITVY